MSVNCVRVLVNLALCGATAASAATYPLSQGGGANDVVASPRERAPKVDPFGLWVVYLDDAVSDGVEELWSASLRGGDPIRLSGGMNGGDQVGKFEVAADGSFVAYLVAYAAEPVQLYLTPIDGGSPLRMSHDLDPGGFVADFAISPDAQWLVYTAQTDPNRIDIFRVPVGGGGAQGYSFPDGSICLPQVDGFTISGDSTWLAFRTQHYCSGVLGYSRGIYWAALSDTTAYLGAQTFDSGFIPSFDFTEPPAGQTPLLVYIFDVDGSVGYLGTNAPAKLQWSDATTFGNDHIISGTIADGGNVVSFAVVPQTQKVVFRADRDFDEYFELFLTTAGVHGVVQVPTQIHEGLTTNVREPYAVSADGAYVVYVQDDNPIGSVDFEYLRSTALAAPGGSNLLAQIPVPGEVLRFEIAPGSSRVVLRADRDEADRDELFSVPIGGGATTRLNPTGNILLTTWDVLDFAISPDGAQVQFVHDSETFLSGAHSSSLRSSPIAGGGSVALGPTVNRLTSEGFVGLWAPLRADWVVSLNDWQSPGVRRLTLSDGCLFCDGFEGTGDGLQRWN